MKKLTVQRKFTSTN